MKKGDKTKILTLVLAGGKGRRLAPFTKKMAKPALPSAGKYRLIDFSLSNCSNSGLREVGVLTPYQSPILKTHLGRGQAWGLDGKAGGFSLLPPPPKEEAFEEGSKEDFKEGSMGYKGTAAAVFQNIDYIDQAGPDLVLILSADHIYRMDYSIFIDFHLEKKAAATVAVRPVPIEEAHRFGIVSVDDDQVITDFEEKPDPPTSNLASMGIYVFDWPTLRKYLEEDQLKDESSHDFGKDLIPSMLGKGERTLAYPFGGYWQDLGTIQSYWQASMDLLSAKSLDLYDSDWPFYSAESDLGPSFIREGADVSESILGPGVRVSGRIRKSLIFSGASVAKDCLIKESIIMPGARIGQGVRLYRAIVGENALIKDFVQLGDPDQSRLSIVDHEQVVFNDD